MILSALRTFNFRTEAKKERNKKNKTENKRVMERESLNTSDQWTGPRALSTSEKLSLVLEKLRMSSECDII